jgi:hypothetical protein
METRSSDGSRWVADSRPPVYQPFFAAFFDGLATFDTVMVVPSISPVSLTALDASGSPSSPIRVYAIELRAAREGPYSRTASQNTGVTAGPRPACDRNERVADSLTARDSGACRTEPPRMGSRAAVHHLSGRYRVRTLARWQLGVRPSPDR